jgi:membrane-associated protease RseP (regulator of RpoE activity)
MVLIAFVCALGPLVFFHELGHYLVARLFKVPAEIFSIGFGRELFGWTDKQGTRWKGLVAAARRLCEVRRGHGPVERASR